MNVTRRMFHKLLLVACVNSGKSDVEPLAMDGDREILELVEVALDAAESDLISSRMRAAEGYLDRLNPHVPHLMTTGDLNLQRRYFRALAITSRDTGKLDQSIGAYEQLRLIAELDNDRGTAAEAVYGKVICLMNGRKLALAELVMRSHEHELLAMKDPRLQVEFAFWRARLFEDRKLLGLARNICEDTVLPLSAEHEDPGLQIARCVFSARLSLQGRNRNFANAEKMVSKAADLLLPGTPLLRKGQLMTTQALFALRTGSTDEAESLYRRAKMVFDVGGIVTPHMLALEAELNRRLA